jgi:hypothetical protein
MILIANDIDIDALLPLTINNGTANRMLTAIYDTKLFVMSNAVRYKKPLIGQGKYRP